jgi:hypothetical protein
MSLRKNFEKLAAANCWPKTFGVVGHLAISPRLRGPPAHQLRKSYSSAAENGSDFAEIHSTSARPKTARALMHFQLVVDDDGLPHGQPRMGWPGSDDGTGSVAGMVVGLLEAPHDSANQIRKGRVG